MTAAKKLPDSKATAPQYCALRPLPPRAFAANVSVDRAEIILETSKYWVNGTVLKYFFFTSKGMKSDVGAKELALVRQAFAAWQAIGIGISFEETDDADEAQIRIAFVRGDGAWSYIGRNCLSIPKSQQTMNFGWNLLEDSRTVGVAIHEIGHAIGFPHEHQNPNAGITWDEPAVLAYFAAPPNNWDEATVRSNILDKLPKTAVKGSGWDPASIMEYSFPPGLVTAPPPYDKKGINPPGDRLSKIDIEWTAKFYPALAGKDYRLLTETESAPLKLKNGEQANFRFTPKATRQHEIRIFGKIDAVLVVFEERGKTKKDYLVGQDDSGTDDNVYVKLRLQKGKDYLITARALYVDPDSSAAIMIW